MTEPIISVENLSKRYRIGVKEKGHNQFREVITDALTAPMRNLKRLRKLTKFDDSEISHSSSNPISRAGKPAEDDIIWALKDVSFEVNKGEVLGIIGRNGAGKSTLLKILSRITEPTTGDVKIYGRISSLLEVGTGFHPELTGRENIFLNGAILGMRKEEIKRKFEEIVAFAETEKFIDTPVKYYSSGMYVRLAFAVAAHLEPEILLVDEVLAVGDIAFQKKCLGKMEDVSKEGRTVLFVSHNMGAVRTLTNKCIYLNEGRIKSNGSTDQVVQHYLDEVQGYTTRGKRNLELYHRESVSQSPVRFTRVWVDNIKDEVPIIEMVQNFSICIELETSIEIRGAHLGFGIKKRDGTQVTVMLSIDHGFRLFLAPGKHVVTCTIGDLPLTPGEYLVDVGINQSTQTRAWDVILDYPLFTVVDRAGQVVHWTERPWGAVHWRDVTWSIQS